MYFRIALSFIIYKKIKIAEIAMVPASPAFPAIRITPSRLTSHIMSNIIMSNRRKCRKRMKIRFGVIGQTRTWPSPRWGNDQERSNFGIYHNSKIIFSKKSGFYKRKMYVFIVCRFTRKIMHQFSEKVKRKKGHFKFWAKFGSITWGIGHYVGYGLFVAGYGMTDHTVISLI